MKLRPYQKRWVNNVARLFFVLKSRQIGWSLTVSLIAINEAIEKKVDVLMISASERQSKRLIRYVVKWGDEIKKTTGKKVIKSYTSEKVILVNNQEIISVPANPDTIAGFSGTIILDEFSRLSNSFEMWDSCYPMITSDPRYRIIIGSTPMGEQGKFFDIWEHGTRFIKDKVDIYDAIKDGYTVDVEEIKAECGDAETFAQEFECKFLSDTESYFSLALIESCTVPSVDVLKHSGATGKGQFFIGMDIGRIRDLTVIYILEKIEDMFYTRSLEIMKQAPFSTQETRMSFLIDQYKPVRVCIDSSGLGTQLAEDLGNRYGCVEGITFTNAVKEDLAVTAKRQFEERTIRIPDDRDLIYDIHAIKRMTTSAGNVRFDCARTEKGHSDRFWGMALAVHAGSSPAFVPEHRSVSSKYPSEKRFVSQMEGF